MNAFRRLLAMLGIALLAGCAGSPDPYVYRYVPGRTATLGEGGIALAPRNAPGDVQAAIAAGNRIANSPYVYGGGHAPGGSEGYDCSGAASFVLRAAGALRGANVSGEFRHYGERGPGDWIDVYARRGHVFLAVAGLRFDTSGGATRGPHWTTRSRSADGYVLRHPAGF